VFNSPSKNGVGGQYSQLARQGVSRRAPNVNYNQLIVAGTRLASVAGSQSNEIQNAIYTMLVGMKEMVERQDFSSPNYDGTVFEPLANQIASLVSHQTVSHVKGLPKAKFGNRQGKPPEYRLGSCKSTSTRLPNNCSFCGGGGGGRHHTSMAKCPVKQNLGFCYDVKKDITAVGSEIGMIFNGGSHGFIDVAAMRDFSRHKYIKDSFPGGTRRLQVKGFTAGMNERFLLCDCINNKGAVITRQEGTGCVSYKDVFLSEMCVMTNMKQCDYIFFRPIGKRGTEESNHERQAFALKQPPTETMKFALKQPPTATMKVSCADVDKPSLTSAVEEQKQTSTREDDAESSDGDNLTIAQLGKSHTKQKRGATTDSTKRGTNDCTRKSKRTRRATKKADAK